MNLSKYFTNDISRDKITIDISLILSLKYSKIWQGCANDSPEIAQRIFKNSEKSIGATGFEPAT